MFACKSGDSTVFNCIVIEQVIKQKETVNPLDDINLLSQCWCGQMQILRLGRHRRASRNKGQRLLVGLQAGILNALIYFLT